MDEAAPTQTEPSFAKTFLRPALGLLVVPLLGLWFSTHYLGKWSAAAQTEVFANIDQAVAEASEPVAAADIAAAKAAASGIDLGDVALEECGAFGFTRAPANVAAEVCSTVLQFSWVRAASKVLLGLALVVAAILALALLWARRAPRRQHQAFALGWTTLRAFSIPHLLGQGAIIIFLSFWVTAMWFEFYSIKLIGIAGVLAVVGVFVAFKAIFAKSEYVPQEHALMLRETDAPAFFENLRSLAAKVGTKPPETVLVGIDDNFFVTESPLAIFDRYEIAGQPAPRLTQVHGRTLFVSLALLRTLEKDEANAVLAHELGHFAADDTGQSRKLAPLLRRFGTYLETTSDTLTFGVTSWMVAFRALFERVAAAHSRIAEFAADGVAASVVGKEAAARALVKIVAYATYRSQTEQQLLDEKQELKEIGIAQRVSRGFSHFVAANDATASLLTKATPHPFDSHPPLHERVARLASWQITGDLVGQLANTPTQTLYAEIASAQAKEQALWQAYEARFAEAHDFKLAVSVMPTTPEEIARVERHFPPVEIAADIGVIGLTYRGLTLPGDDEIPFDAMTDVERKDVTFKGNCLVFKANGVTHTIRLDKMANQGAALLEPFGNYYARHQHSHAQVAGA
ncbi:MAG: M48 family metallopeptidase [Myxococcales bacterium]|nr:M48 family metallopeptidase [Myxococcales bacterium]